MVVRVWSLEQIASASAGNLPEMQSLRTHSRHTAPEPRGQGAAICVLTSFSGDFDTKSLRVIGLEDARSSLTLPSVKHCHLVVFEWEEAGVSSGRESWLGWAAWRMHLLFGGESPGLTNDYRSHGEEILGRVSLATWKGSSDNMGEFFPGASGWEEAGCNIFIRNSLHASRSVYTNRNDVWFGPRSRVPRDMKTPSNHCPHFFFFF